MANSMLYPIIKEMSLIGNSYLQGTLWQRMVIIIMLSFLDSLHVCAQISGTYVGNGRNYQIHEDGTFRLELTGGMSYSYTYGHWEQKQDTLILNSRYQTANKWPIQVSESKDTALVDWLRCVVYDIDNQPLELSSARIIINYTDTLNSNDPYDGSMFTFPYEKPIRNLKVQYYNPVLSCTYFTEVYKPRDTESNSFHISLFFENDYFPLEEAKLVHSGDTLISSRISPDFGKQSEYYLRLSD